MNEIDDLRAEHCVACNRDSPRVTPLELSTLFAMLPDWAIDTVDDVPRLVRAFRFTRYRMGLDFAHRVGVLADENDHHPVIVTEARRITVSWWTHAIGGLHRNDFVMAAKTDRVFRETVDA